MNIQLNINKSEFTPKLFPYLLDYSHRKEGYMGSAGSAKSYFITQKCIIRACNTPGIRILVTRRYGTTLRNSCFSLFKEILTKWKLIETKAVTINESDMRIRLFNGSEIIFIGLDDENKLLSINNIGTIFIEEAYECSRDIVEQLDLRLRGHTENLQIIMAWNPINKNHWLYNYWEVNPPENSLYVHTTYKDNPFLPDEYIRSIEELKERNPQKWRVFGEGQWGVNTDALVFHNWEIQDFDEMELAKKLEHRTGSDLGFIDATAVITSLYDSENSTIYVYDEFYKSGCQLDEVYQNILNMNLSKSIIYMDSAEPRTIDYFRRQGLNVKPCIKGQGSVKSRIYFLQNNKIIVKPNCKKMIMELENFSYEKNKVTGEYDEDKTTHEFSHAIDALGYAFSDIYTKTKLRTISKSILGL